MLLKEAVLLLIIFAKEATQVVRNGILDLNRYVLLHEVLDESVVILIVLRLQLNLSLRCLNPVLPLANLFDLRCHQHCFINLLLQ